MPSSDECIQGRLEIFQWAVESIQNQGHSEFSAKEIVKRMGYEEQVKDAEKVRGPIYRGPYSAY